MTNRRPLKARGWSMMQATSRIICAYNITPNHISLLSIVFSALAGYIFLLFPNAGSTLWLYVPAILLCLIGRGFCNILDGLVAVEGGKGTASGELFNDVPDRISDVCIIVGAGYAAGVPLWGWLAAILAVMTAYTRTLGKSLGAPADFQGPMAKLERMLVLGAACLFTPIEAVFTDEYVLLPASLAIIIIGCVITMQKRLKRAYKYLESAPRA